MVNILSSAAISIVASLLLCRFSKLNTTHWIFSVLWFSFFILACNLYYRNKAGNVEFTKILLAGIVIKLLLSFVIILVYFLIFKSRLFSFSMHFILHYVIFTILEIKYLSSLIKSSYSA